MSSDRLCIKRFECVNFDPTRGHRSNPCENYKPKTPEFEVGDWVVGKDGKLTQVRMNKIDGGLYANDGFIGYVDSDYKGRDYKHIRHAKESNWWFERKGVQVMIEFTAYNTANIRTGDSFWNEVCCNTAKLIAQALDIPIKPYNWVEKGAIG